MEGWLQDGLPVVLLLTGIERWAAARWRNDVAAFRAFTQSNQERLFVVYVCVERETLRRTFLTRGEPLYREGMIVIMQSDGTNGVAGDCAVSITASVLMLVKQHDDHRLPDFTPAHAFAQSGEVDHLDQRSCINGPPS